MMTSVSFYLGSLIATVIKSRVGKLKKISALRAKFSPNSLPTLA